MKRLFITRLAFHDLESIWSYIAAESLAAADRVRDDIEVAIRKLCEMPGMGHKRADVANRHYRFWRAHSYLIAYREQGISKRDMSKKLTGGSGQPRHDLDSSKMPVKTSSQHGAAGDANLAPLEPERFDAPAVATVACAHFIHDLYPAFIAPLVPLLMEKHGMTYAIASGLMTLNRWPGAAQPILGYWADRCDSRILMILGPVVTALSVCLLGLAPSYAAIAALLLIGGISSSAFHPTAGAMATRASGRDWGRGTSFFMTGGELGRALGPVFIATVVVAVGLTNIWIAAIPAVAIAGLVYLQLGKRRPRVGHAAPPTGLREILRTRWRVLLLLMLIIVFRSLVIASFQIFFPAFVTSLGGSLIYGSMALTVYEIGGVAGAFVGGPLSDRFGRKTVMAVSQAVAGPLLFGALTFAREPIGLPLLALGGLLALCAGPVQLTLVQELLPNNRSMATGIVMSLGFEGQVFAAIGIGLVADSIGIQSALAWSVLASMLSLPFTLLLPETRRGRSGAL